MNQPICGDEWITLWHNERQIVYVQMGDGAMAVPLTPEGDVLFITEPSPAYGERILGLPSGLVDTEELPVEAANRELQEEIGLKAGRLTLLGELNPMVKYVHCRISIFLARDFTPNKLQGDEDEHWHIEVERIPLRDFESFIASGRLTDSTAIAALYLARRYLADTV
jgi:ADP-ribose diphosphatase